MIVLPELRVHQPIYDRIDAGVHVEQPGRELVQPVRQQVQLTVYHVDEEVKAETCDEPDEDDDHHFGQLEFSVVHGGGGGLSWGVGWNSSGWVKGEKFS